MTMFPSAKTSLSYPLYAADFDPEDDRYLIVGGGGGEGRSGVGNHITVLNTQSPNQLVQVADIELSRDEDSVTSLAAVRRLKPASTLILAGINSSSAAQEADRNEHLRSFRIDYPSDGGQAQTTEKNEKASESSEKGSIELISRRSLFRSSTATRKETYQRVLRLSPTYKKNVKFRIAALATGLAPAGEIVFVEARSGTNDDLLLGQIALEKGQEAADVDIINSADGSYDVAYCTDYEVSVCHLDPSKKSQALEPRCVYITPHPDVFASVKSRPTFRAIRFLAPGLLLLLANRPQRSGTELLVLRYGQGLGEVISHTRLHRAMKAGIGLDVSNLGHHEGDEAKQFVVAVAGQDISIELLTLDYNPTKQDCQLRHSTTFTNVHPLQMTRICMSSVILPPSEKRSPMELKLASVSMGNTVVVHRLPLVEVTNSSSRPRYALAGPQESGYFRLSLLVLLLAIILSFIWMKSVEK
ncbi:MAG: hypothetical protein M1823_001705 [Watsoniomyces obsoletus]|nr:MAG: hypothetical protein M1823_001705 [Watsoniomyces obsoletus]